MESFCAGDSCCRLVQYFVEIPQEKNTIDVYLNIPKRQVQFTLQGSCVGSLDILADIKSVKPVIICKRFYGIFKIKYTEWKNCKEYNALLPNDITKCNIALYKTVSPKFVDDII